MRGHEMVHSPPLPSPQGDEWHPRVKGVTQTLAPCLSAIMATMALLPRYFIPVLLMFCTHLKSGVNLV
jgi:hypothetical protein